MADVRKTLQELGEQARQVADQVTNFADQTAKSNDLTAFKDKAAEEFEATKKTTSDAVGRITNTRQRSLYTEIAEACEGINDALFREEGGMTAEMQQTLSAIIAKTLAVATTSSTVIGR